MLSYSQHLLCNLWLECGRPHEADWAVQMIAVGNDAQSIFKFYVEVLYGAGNRAIAMPPRGIYTRKAQACEDFNRQMLRAAACGRLVRCTCFTQETLHMSL